MDKTDMSMEGTAAMIMTVFDEMWDHFIQANGSFEPFMDLYLQRWLHSYVPASSLYQILTNIFKTNRDQLVKLTTVDPPVMVRITGITPDHGLLRTIPERSTYHSYRGEEFIDLQPDGNSFDLMAGLIRTKS